MSGDNGTTSRAPYIEGGQGLNKRQKRLLETTNIEPMRACRGRNFSGGRSASNNRASVVERVSSSNTVQGRGHSHSSVDPNTPHLDGDVPFVRPTPPRLDIVLDSLLVEGLNYGEFDPETEAAILEKVAEGETPITPGSSSSAVIATEKKTRRVAKLKLPPPERQIFLHGKRQQREQEGKSDSEEDDDGGSESANISEDENGGLGSESDLDIAEEDDLREHAHSKNNEQGEDDGTEDEDEASSGDDANGFSNDSKINIDDLQHLSSFHRHLGHSLTNEDADKLVKIKLKYKWEIPAPNMLMSKWLGTNEQLVKNLSSDVVHGIKQKLYKHWLDTYKASGFADLDPRLRFYFSLCDSYQDILHCNKKPFYLKGEEDSVIMDAYLMHTLNHIFKTRDLVSKNNAKLSREEEGNDEELLNHGFTRPKVMFLLPLRSIAYRIVKRLIQLAPASNKTNVEHIDRFSEEFGTADVEEDDGSSKNKKPDKPKDFQRLFGGNNNDHFLIGIKLTKRCIKLYGDYYSSDIILASPLGLVTKIAEAGEEKEKDVDFLSSIEVLIIDHADVIAMQNWSHLNTVVEQLNRIPSKQHGTDIMRIRQWYLDGHARFYRQTILLGSFLNPDMNVLFSRSCLNYDGKIKLLTQYKGVLPKVLLQVRQVYDRFDAPSIVDMDDARLDYFCKKVFPKIKDSMEGSTMLFISSYFEFVRIRNFLKSQNASFCLLGEYTKPEDISRARVWFFEGKRKIILYTERAHFYHRYKIRGIKNLIIYSLPERKEFYPEIINMIQGSENMMCTVLFSRFDYLRLERIVGTADAKRLVSSDKKIFVYC